MLLHLFDWVFVFAPHLINNDFVLTQSFNDMCHLYSNDLLANKKIFRKTKGNCYILGNGDLILYLTRHTSLLNLQTIISRINLSITILPKNKMPLD